jgi:enediyne biosynthesis protein E2
VDKAVSLAASTIVTESGPGAEPVYELWRRRIRAHFEQDDAGR